MSKSSIRHVRSVLIAEDNPSLRETLRNVLAELTSAEVHAVSSVEECRQFLERKLPELVVLDVQLEGGDAFDVLALLESRTPTPVIVALSGAAGPDDAFRLAQCGVRRYVKKPLDLPSLEAAIIEALAEGPDIKPHLRALVGHVPLQEFEELVRTTLLEEALARSRGNRRAAARILHVSRQLLQHMLRKLPSST